jgi:hypothetical protein
MGALQGIPGEGGIVRLIFPLVFLAGCSSHPGLVSTLKAADSVGRGLARVLGYCESNGADISSAVARANEGDLGGAMAIAQRLVAELRSKGVETPEDTKAILKLAQELYAAKAVEQAARALAGKNAEGK